MTATAPEPDLLRFVTCGSVDHGKSTLIGRLLHDAGLLLADHLAAAAAASRRWGTQGATTDLALLVDGLLAEREQGITIDVAHRYFGTATRRFVVTDAPGHAQYTRNMVTAASQAQLALILVDVRAGVVEQTRRHTVLAHLLGIRQLLLVVNKMDLAGWDEARFRAIEADYRAFVARLDPAPEVTALPISALHGDQVVVPSGSMPWFDGPTLMGFLESCPIAPDDRAAGPLRLPVQWVRRPSPAAPDFRGFGGLVVGGRLRPGDAVRVLPSGRRTAVERIVAMEGDRAEAAAGESVTLTLADAVDVSRGDLLCADDAPAEVADQFECTLVWMADEPMLPGRRYAMKLGTRAVEMWVSDLKHRIDIETLEPVAARALALNEIGVCRIALDRRVAFDAYADNRDMGGFIVVDRDSFATVGAGMLHFALRRAHNLHPPRLAVDRHARAALNGHPGAVLWFTGLSGAGKSTIANLVEQRLHALGRRTYLLDGDHLRQGLNRDLGFTAADRVENVRRAAEVARLMADAGLIVLVALISPFRAERELARSLMPAGEFVEVFVDVPLEIAEARDPKGLYARARRGQLPNFTGVDSPYEPPLAPEVHLAADRMSADEAAERVIATLRS